MNVTETKTTIKYVMPPRESALLVSGHGLGKSEVVRQIAAELSEELNKPFFCIDIRLSQRETGDIIGYPIPKDSFNVSREVYKNGKLNVVEQVAHNVMVHSLPIWFPTDPDSCGILFFDEIDRAPKDVQQAAFEIVLDYRLNLNPLPIGWRVVAAINGDQDKYTVHGMDPALLDRFGVIFFKPAFSEWMEHAGKIGVHKSITGYLSKFDTDLYTPEKIDPGIKVYPSPRAWVKLSNCLNYAAKNGQDLIKDIKHDDTYITKLAAAYIGSFVGVNWVEYVKNSYHVFSAEDILNRWDLQIENDFKVMEPVDVMFYSGQIINYISRKNLSNTQRNNLTRFFLSIPREAASGFFTDFNSKCKEECYKWFKGDDRVCDRANEVITKR